MHLLLRTALSALLVTTAAPPLPPVHPQGRVGFTGLLMWHDVVPDKKQVWFDTTVGELKEQGGRDIITDGSGKLVSALMNCGLVDEYQLWMHPVFLGKGNPMFRNTQDLVSLSLQDEKTFSSGVVLLFYKRPSV